ncbi:ATP-grasp domain-containing protein [Pontibacter populi]|uniref:Prokaryotic glutathione synthetase ATP-binding domain-containing protein n=1 Tax=Pontibacter populi TaxID=890055 RepID=A0ABV1RPL4_9BACT
MQIQQIALITCESLGSYTANADSEDERLYQFLKGKGLPVSWQVWDDASVDWSRFDALIIKSPWDYFDKIEAFYSWLDKVEAAGCKVLNPVKTVRWNADKLYFKDMEAAGVTIVPTVWLEQGSSFVAGAAFVELGSEKIIVKPRVSGGAKNTFALTIDEAIARTSEINQLLEQEPFLAQPFIEEIKTDGEWSFIFFNGNYSHTVLKTAKPGDFRVQHFFGGTIHTPTPPAALLATAQTIVDKFAKDCLYARVDGVALKNELVLMELELIEPFLFLSTSEGSLERYYQALLAQL